ncbi:substrate-binding domain-containing protein [Microlunatus sp. Y2014]|uniref:substrate-binding domain-containing protein n=1 Tax=Microlunatus sp. Y2014 TaxID=3418488 RepID=UPI003DA71FD3
MTSRLQANRRRSELVSGLLSAIDRAELRPGDQIPSLTSLAKQYELSKPTVLATLQPLLDDGTLESVPSVGIFVAELHDRQPGCYVMVYQPRQPGEPAMAPLPTAAHGFEDRMAWHGGKSVVLGVQDFLRQQSQASLPTVHGVFAFAGVRLDEVLATLEPATRLVAYLGGRIPPGDPVDDRVSFVDLDNVSGGRLAAEQLLRGGHESIAFLGLHTPDNPYFRWSRMRARGWAEAVRRRRPRATLLCIRPEPAEGVGPEHYERALAEVARNAADRLDEFDACIGADDMVLIMLARELRRRGVPRDDWPAMVGFEGLSDAADLIVTSVRPRWADLGASAADHLIMTPGDPRHPARVSEVAMTVVARPLVLPGRT